MKQLLQNYKSGELILADVPAPFCRSNGVLVGNVASLVSAGTERQMIDLARKSLIRKALARPDLVKKVLDVAKTDGILEAYQISKSRLETPLPLGYSSAGEVIGVGEEVQGIKAGDRVACAGSGYACHAEIIFTDRLSTDEEGLDKTIESFRQKWDLMEEAASFAPGASSAVRDRGN